MEELRVQSRKKRSLYGLINAVFGGMLVFKSYLPLGLYIRAESSHLQGSEGPALHGTKCAGLG